MEGWAVDNGDTLERAVCRLCFVFVARSSFLGCEYSKSSAVVRVEPRIEQTNEQ